MLQSAYSYDHRSVECLHCGAVVIGLPGSQGDCDQCGSTAEIVVRARDGEPPAQGVEQPDLWEQVARFDPKGPLVAWLPPALSRAELIASDPRNRDAGISALRRELEEARQAAEASASVDAGDRLFRISVALARAYEAADEHLSCRAVLEASLDRLGRREQRDIVRCSLARKALRAGDVTSYHAWLADCDPSPSTIEVDGELRCARALLPFRDGSWQPVLDALGRSHKEVPLAFTIAPLGHCLRAHALAGLGDHDAARAEIRHLAARVPLGYVRVKHTWARYEGPSSPYAVQVARSASPAPTPPSGQPAVRVPEPKRLPWVAIVVGTLIVAAAVALGIHYGTG